MKITHGKLRGRNKEATAVAYSIKAIMKKYGFELVGYVTRKLIDKEVSRAKLYRSIKEAEIELEELKKTKI